MLRRYKRGSGRSSADVVPRIGNRRRYGFARTALRLCDSLQSSNARLHHFAKGSGIVAQHTLRELWAGGTKLFRRFPCRTKIRAIDFVKKPRTLGGGTRLIHAARIQFLERAGIFGRRNRRAISRRLRPRLLHTIPKLPRLFPAPRILHLRRQPSRRLRGVVTAAHYDVFSPLHRRAWRFLSRGRVVADSECRRATIQLLLRLRLDLKNL